MSASRDRVLTQLRQVSGAVCDDCVPGLAALKSRHDARRLCQEIEKRGEARRQNGQCALCGRTKTVTTVHLGVHDRQREDATVREESDHTDTGDPGVSHPVQRAWYWEGHVQNMLLSWLKNQDFLIERVADTATREAGKDIIAVTADGKTLWVSVKGFPEGTNPYPQARHWFSSAVFDIVLYCDERADVELALAFPDGFQTYRALASRLGCFRKTIPFTIYWISESGSVRIG